MYQRQTFLTYLRYLEQMMWENTLILAQMIFCLTTKIGLKFCWFHDEDDTIKDFSVSQNLFAQRNLNITIKDVIDIWHNHEIKQDIHSSHNAIIEHKWTIMTNMYPWVHNKQISSEDIVITSALSMSYENMLILVSATTAYFEYHFIDCLIITINSD